MEPPYEVSQAQVAPESAESSPAYELAKRKAPMASWGRAAPDASNPARRKRMVIYNAQLRMNVSNVTAKLEEAIQIAEAVGGYMKARRDSQITVRIPVAKLKTYLTDVKKLGTVVSESITSQDITEEYTDLEIRLKNLEKTLKRFRELLPKADAIKDVLAIEREIGRITGEIERIKGRIKFLSEQAALATVTIHFNAPQPGGPAKRPVTPFSWVRRLGIEKLFR